MIRYFWRTAFVLAVSATMAVTMSAQAGRKISRKTATEPPGISFDQQQASISGITPGASMVWFTISQEFARYPARINYEAEIATADENGQLQVGLEDPTPSTWVVVDLQSGGSALAASDLSEVTSSALPASSLRYRTETAGAALEFEGGDSHLLYVRPGVGAWQLSGGNQLALADMTAVGDSPAPPDDFAPGDVITIIDPVSLSVRSLRVE